MFDVSFFELLLVSVVALLVLGPEKLPGAVRTAGLWIGRLKRSFNNIKKDIEKEIGADDIRRQLRNEAIMEKFDKTKSEFTKTIGSVKSEVKSVKDDLDLKKQFDAVAGFGAPTADAEDSAIAKEEAEASLEKTTTPAEPSSSPPPPPSETSSSAPELDFEADSESTTVDSKASE